MRIAVGLAALVLGSEARPALAAREEPTLPEVTPLAPPTSHASLGRSAVPSLPGDAGIEPAPAAAAREASIALPPSWVARFIEAHTQVPLLDALDTGEGRAWRRGMPVRGSPGHVSRVLSRIEAREDGRRWHLVPRAALEGRLRTSLAACLLATDADAPWPALVLHSAGVEVRIAGVPGAVEVAFSQPVGVLPELLEGCYTDAAKDPLGAYQEPRPAWLTLRQDEPGLDGQPGEVPAREEQGRPWLRAIDLQPEGTLADVVLGPAVPPGAQLHYAPVPDALLWLQLPGCRAADPLGVLPADPERVRVPGLQPEVLIAAYARGQGEALSRILPPGLAGPAPGRPIASSRPAPTAPLSLVPQSGEGTLIAVAFDPHDPLLRGLAERLAVLLRARGHRMHPLVAPDEREDPCARLLRWRAESHDPALSLLALAGRHPALASTSARAALRDPRLVAADAVLRRAAAEDLERAWLQSGAIVPLLSAERFVAADPALLGIRLRADGLPLLHEAYRWSPP